MDITQIPTTMLDDGCWQCQFCGTLHTWQDIIHVINQNFACRDCAELITSLN